MKTVADILHFWFYFIYTGFWFCLLGNDIFLQITKGKYIEKWWSWHLQEIQPENYRGKITICVFCNYTEIWIRDCIIVVYLWFYVWPQENNNGILFRIYLSKQQLTLTTRNDISWNYSLESTIIRFLYGD